MTQCVSCLYQYEETYMTKHGDICKECVVDFVWWLLPRTKGDKIGEWLSR